MGVTGVTFLKLSQTMGITQKTVHSSALMLQARRMSFMTGTSLCLRFVCFWIFPTYNWQRMEPNLFTDNSSSIPPPGGDGHPTEGFLAAQPPGHLHQHHTGSEGAWGGGEQSGLVQKGSQGQCALCIFFNRAFHSESWCSSTPPPAPLRCSSSRFKLRLADWLIAAAYSVAQLRLCGSQIHAERW